MCGREDVSVRWYEDRKEKICDICAKIFTSETPELTATSSQDFTF